MPVEYAKEPRAAYLRVARIKEVERLAVHLPMFHRVEALCVNVIVHTVRHKNLSPIALQLQQHPTEQFSGCVLL